MIVAIAVLAVLILLNGVFAMSELAMMTARRSRLQRDAAAGSKSAATALKLAGEPTKFLSTVQVGITLIGILSGAFAEDAISTRIEARISGIAALAPYADAISLIGVVLVITYFSLVFGELVPKRIALAYPELMASTIARPLSALSYVAAWPVKVLSLSTEWIAKALRIRHVTGDDVSEDDVRFLMARAATTGVFTRQEHTIFNRLLRVGDFTVRDLMVPRMDIVWIDESATPNELRVLIGTSPYSHFPVCRGSVDKILGVVHIKDLIAYGLLAGAEFEVIAVAHSPLFVPETMPALKLLEQFKSTKVHIAFVVDEHGEIDGLLTLNDLVSALVGDIARRGEPLPPHATRRKDGSWLIDGRLPINELIPTLGLPYTTAETLPNVSTAAGLVIACLGQIPKVGEYVEWNGWRLEVADMDGQRIDQILAQKNPAKHQQQST